MKKKTKRKIKDLQRQIDILEVKISKLEFNDGVRSRKEREEEIANAFGEPQMQLVPEPKKTLRMFKGGIR